MALSKPFNLNGDPTAETLQQTDYMLEQLYNGVLNAGGPHALLSASHTDATPASVTRGALIVGQGVTPTWATLLVGTANTILRSDGVDATWAKVVVTTDLTGVLPIANGGTNISTYAQGDLLYASATDVLSKLAKNTTSHRYLSNSGTGVPSWAAIDLTDGVTGALATGNGGTGVTSYSIGDMLYYGGSVGVLTKLAIGTANRILQSGGAGVGPGWTGYAMPNGVTAGDTFYASSGTVVTVLAKDTNATRYLSNTGASNIPAWAQINLANGVTGVLPYANFVNASAASVLVGRGSASGAGVFQEITLGTGLTMTNQVLSSSGGGGGGTNALLDGTNHTDTLAGTVTRGDVIYGNSTPKWARKAVGTGVLVADGTDVTGWTQAPTLTTPSMTIPVVSTRIDLTGGQIKFPATQVPSSDPNTLDDYEEGTWTPTDASGAGLTLKDPDTHSSGAKGGYVKIGQMVFQAHAIEYPTTADVSTAKIGGFPFTTENAAAPIYWGGYHTYNTSNGVTWNLNANKSNADGFYGFSPTLTVQTNANMATKVIYGNVQYRCTG